MTLIASRACVGLVFIVGASIGGCATTLDEKENHGSASSAEIAPSGGSCGMEGSVLMCGNQIVDVHGQPRLDSMVVDHLRTTHSSFLCYSPGAPHSGGNNIWYFTQGDDNDAEGYVPASALNTSTDPVPGLMKCGDAPAHASAGGDPIALARQWVAAEMPYCGGMNGSEDILCGGTCSRTGDAQTPEWDEYRSDCSGLVSYAWGLPAPGRITGEFAPYDTSVSELTTFEDLAPGDALNNDHHIILFGGWTDKENNMAMIIEEYDCGEIAHEIEISVEKDGDSTVMAKGEMFYAIKHKAASE